MSYTNIDNWEHDVFVTYRDIDCKLQRAAPSEVHSILIERCMRFEAHHRNVHVTHYIPLKCGDYYEYFTNNVAYITCSSCCKRLNAEQIIMAGKEVLRRYYTRIHRDELNRLYKKKRRYNAY